MKALSGSAGTSRCCIAFSLIFAVYGARPGSSQATTVPPGQTAEVQNDQPGYTLKLKTQLVTLDVVVNDKDGKPVRGLTRNDFAIVEDKMAQPILSFEATEPPSAGHAPLQVHSTSELDRTAPGAPVSIVVLDELTTKFEDQYFARYSLEKYLSKQADILDQPLTLIARNYHGTQVLLDYTTSKKEVLSALNRHLAANDYKATDPTAPEDQIIAEFTSLVEIAKATQGHPGHKTLIWIGKGFPSMQRDGIPAEKDERLDAAIARCANLLRDARVTLYTIDPAGVSAPEQTLSAAGDLVTEDPFGTQVGFMQMATATGGQSLHGRNDIDRVIDSTVQDGQIFYTLSYHPAVANASDKPKAFRQIHVIVKGGALLATTREGYYPAAIASAGAAEAEEAGKLSADDRFNVAAAAQGLMVFDGIPLTITRDAAAPDTFHLAFPAATLALADDGSKVTGQVSVIAISYDKAGKLLNRTGRVVSLHLPSLQSGLAESRKLDLTVSLDTKAPTARVRFIVTGNAKIGADNFFLVSRDTLTDRATGLKSTGKSPK